MLAQCASSQLEGSTPKSCSTQLALQDRLAEPHGAWKLIKFLALMALPLDRTSVG